MNADLQLDSLKLGTEEGERSSALFPFRHPKVHFVSRDFRFTIPNLVTLLTAIPGRVKNRLYFRQWRRLGNSTDVLKLPSTAPGCPTAIASRGKRAFKFSLFQYNV